MENFQSNRGDMVGNKLSQPQKSLLPYTYDDKTVCSSIHRNNTDDSVRRLRQLSDATETPAGRRTLLTVMSGNATTTALNADNLCSSVDITAGSYDQVLYPVYYGQTVTGQPRSTLKRQEHTEDEHYSPIIFKVTPETSFNSFEADIGLQGGKDEKGHQSPPNYLLSLPNTEASSSCRAGVWKTRLFRISHRKISASKKSVSATRLDSEPQSSTEVAHLEVPGLDETGQFSESNIPRFRNRFKKSSTSSLTVQPPRVNKHNFPWVAISRSTEVVENMNKSCPQSLDLENSESPRSDREKKTLLKEHIGLANIIDSFLPRNLPAAFRRLSFRSKPSSASIYEETISESASKDNFRVQPRKLSKKGQSFEGCVPMEDLQLQSSPVLKTNSKVVPPITYEQLRDWEYSFKHLLADPCGFHYFKQFLKSEYSQENLEFWRHCSDYKNLPDCQLAEYAKRIYHLHLAPQSILEVNLDSATRKSTIDCLQRPDRQTFDDARHTVELLMQKDSYQRFLRSDEFQHLKQVARCNPHASERASRKKKTSKVSPCVGDNSLKITPSIMRVKSADCPCTSSLRCTLSHIPPHHTMGVGLPAYERANSSAYSTARFEDDSDQPLSVSGDAAPQSPYLNVTFNRQAHGNRRMD